MKLTTVQGSAAAFKFGGLKFSHDINSNHFNAYGNRNASGA